MEKEKTYSYKVGWGLELSSFQIKLESVNYRDWKHTSPPSFLEKSRGHGFIIARLRTKAPYLKMSANKLCYSNDYY